MGSQNHIYSKKKLIKWKQGQGEGGGGGGGGGCSLAALRPLRWPREGERDAGSACPGGLVRGWDLVLEGLWGGGSAHGAGEHQMMAWVGDRREHGGTHGWGGVLGC